VEPNSFKENTAVSYSRYDSPDDRIQSISLLACRNEEEQMVRMIVVVACSLAVLSSVAAAQEKQITNDQYAALQKNFAEAYKP
jgi:hypothetical protein